MSVLARKIARAKWEPNEELGARDEIAADAVTADLRTTGNTLSFWRCESSSARDLERAVLALAAAAERPDRLDLVYLDEQAVRESGLALRDTAGDTPVEGLRVHHVDVERLDVTRLTMVARMVAEAHRSSASHMTTKRQVIDLLVQAVEDGLLAIADLKDKMREEVSANLGHGV